MRRQDREGGVMTEKLGFKLTLGAIALILGFVSLATAQELKDLRGAVPPTEEASPPPIYNEINDDKRRARNYPEQPPVIPHNIRDYPITLNANRCLTCHTREFTAESQAPMISITHFMDRDGQVLASVTPRRFFCTQCHVTQADAPDLVENKFMPIEKILQQEKNGEGNGEQTP
jgi:nitrate reductase (cytochrome), electron transfer subunit